MATIYYDKNLCECWKRPPINLAMNYVRRKNHTMWAFKYWVTWLWGEGVCTFAPKGRKGVDWVVMSHRLCPFFKWENLKSLILAFIPKVCPLRIVAKCQRKNLPAIRYIEENKHAECANGEWIDQKDLHVVDLWKLICLGYRKYYFRSFHFRLFKLPRWFTQNHFEML